jgi:hypothetical protein
LREVWPGIHKQAPIFCLDDRQCNVVYNCEVPKDKGSGSTKCEELLGLPANTWQTTACNLYRLQLGIPQQESEELVPVRGNWTADNSTVLTFTKQHSRTNKPHSSSSLGWCL